MQFKSAVAAAITLLMVTAGAGIGHAKDKKKDASGEVGTGIDKQLEWENKVVGPKAGINKDHLAAIQEQGRREDAERKKEPPKKAGRAAGVDAPASAELPTMDIEKPSSGTRKAPKKMASADTHKKDSLDNLLDSEGIKPDNPSGGRTDDGLGSLLASDSSSSAKKSTGSKKHRR